MWAAGPYWFYEDSLKPHSTVDSGSRLGRRTSPREPGYVKNLCSGCIIALNSASAELAEGVDHRRAEPHHPMLRNPSGTALSTQGSGLKTRTAYGKNPKHMRCPNCRRSWTPTRDRHASISRLLNKSAGIPTRVDSFGLRSNSETSLSAHFSGISSWRLPRLVFCSRRFARFAGIPAFGNKARRVRS